MKKIVKIVAIVVAVVLVAAFVAPMLLRGKIAQIVKREANEMLDARVDFEKLDICLLRHFPRASLDLKGLTVVGAGPFEGDTIVAANRISVVVNPMSLFGDDANETLILVTADHETGGMAIGYKTTNYDTFLTNLAHQKMSYAKFDSTYMQGYIANKTPFETAMQDVKNVFGLTLPTDPAAASAGKLLLTDYEVENLRKAYERTLQVGSSSQSKMSQQDYELYGTYIPFSMAVCHTINHKSGMDHTTYAHTGAMVNVYAMGVGAEKFGGVYDNTEIYHKLAELTKVQ